MMAMTIMIATNVNGARQRGNGLPLWFEPAV